jgi:hypothetical protein
VAGINVFRKFFGGAVNTATGYAIGGAMQPTLDPLTQDLANRTWALHPDRPPDPVLLANGVAQGQIDRGAAKAISAMSGISGDNFDLLVQVFDTGPGTASAFELWRRGVIGETAFRRAVKREGVEDEWIDDLVQIHDQLLSVAELANAVVQGHMSQDAAAVEAGKQGFTADRFDVLVQNTGLPPGPETLLDWQRRGILTADQVAQGIREGHTKVKYIPFYEQALQPVLSHVTYAGLRLRGWLTKAESDAGGSLTGYSPEQMQLEYLNRGRPATAHQLHIGYARGAKVAGAANEVDAIRTAVEQSDIRPEYADVLIAGRYTLPGVFALRGLVTSGAFTEAQGEDILLQSGWVPEYAKQVAAFWAHPSNAGAAVNPRVKRAQDQVYNATHSSYLDNEIPRDRALAALEHIGLTAALAGQVVDLWEYENEILVKPLTPAAIKKAYGAGDFSIDEAVSRLVDQQWAAADARVYLTT